MSRTTTPTEAMRPQHPVITALRTLARAYGGAKDADMQEITNELTLLVLYTREAHSADTTVAPEEMERIMSAIGDRLLDLALIGQMCEANLEPHFAEGDKEISWSLTRKGRAEAEQIIERARGRMRA